MNGGGCPFSCGGVGAATVVSVEGGDLEVEDLVGSAVGADVGAVAGPVKSNNERAVALELAHAAPVGNIVNVHIVVVGADTEVSVAGGEGHALVPLAGFTEQVALGLGVRLGADGDLTVVSGDGNPVGVGGNSAGLLAGGEVRQSGSTLSAHLAFRAVSDLNLLGEAVVVGIPEHDLVVITGGPDTAVVDLEAPNFTIGVGHHDSLAGVIGHVDVPDASIAETDNEGALGVVHVDGADEAIELPFFGAAHVVGVPELDAAVTGAGQHLVVTEALNAADETLMGLHGALGRATLEAVDLSVGTTSEAAALGVESAARERGARSGAEKATFLLTVGGPESDVLAASGGESVGSLSAVKGNIEDLVSGSLLHELALTSGSVEAVHAMVVMEISGGNEGGVGGDVDGRNTAGATGELHALHHLAGASVPGEDSGGAADLSSDANLALSADTNGHDVVGVGLAVVGNVLGSVVNFASTEELLLGRAALVVEDNAEGGGHVDYLVLAVEVDVLTRVGGAVSEDVLELVGLLGLVERDGVVAVGLSDLTDPGADGHELLTFSSFFGGEEIIFLLFALTELDLFVLSGLGVVSGSLLANLSAEIGIFFIRSTAHGLKMFRESNALRSCY